MPTVFTLRQQGKKVVIFFHLHLQEQLVKKNVDAAREVVGRRNLFKSMR